MELPAGSCSAKSVQKCAKDGKELYIASAPSMGFSNHIESGNEGYQPEATARKEGEVYILENEKVVVRIDGMNGSIQSLYDKKQRKQAFSSPGNNFALFEDIP